MTTVTVSNLTTDKITVILPSGETIVASSDGVSVTTAVTTTTKALNVVAPAPSPTLAPVVADAPVVSASVSPSQVVIVN